MWPAGCFALADQQRVLLLCLCFPFDFWKIRPQEGIGLVFLSTRGLFLDLRLEERKVQVCNCCHRCVVLQGLPTSCNSSMHKVSEVSGKSKGDCC